MGSGIEERDKWAFRRLAMLLSRTRYDDQGFGKFYLTMMNGVIKTVEAHPIFKEDNDLTPTA